MGCGHPPTAGDLRSWLVVVEHQRLEVSMFGDSGQLQDVELLR